MRDSINKKIGILGGGQLGKMLCQAGSKMSLDISILEKDDSFPAAPICVQFDHGDITNYDDVVAFGSKMDIITIEIENVNIAALEYLENQGKEVYPPTDALKIIRDKGLQKTFYEGSSIPTSDFGLYKNAQAIREAVINGKLTIPFVQKSRTEGYDGKGVHIVRTKGDLDGLLEAPSLVEDMVDVAQEISVIVARSASGTTSSFPVVEMEFHPTANLVEFLFCPSTLSDDIQRQAANLALAVAKKIEIVGLLAVEMFVTNDGQILVNEVAPRPHNSGHHTIEASTISQYEMHLRSILDLPMPQPEITMPSVMINLLGEPDQSGPTHYQGLASALEISGVHPHFYGKKETKPFRKMGHVTIVNASLDKAKDIAHHIKNTLKIVAKS